MAKKKTSKAISVSTSFNFDTVRTKVLATAERLSDKNIGFDHDTYVDHVRKQMEAVDKVASQSYESGSFNPQTYIEKGINSNLWTYLNNPQTAGLGGSAVSDWQLMASFTNNDVVYSCADRNAMAVAKGCKNFKLLTTQPKKATTKTGLSVKKLTFKQKKLVKKAVSDDLEVVEITEHPLIDLLTTTADEDLNGFQIFYASQLCLEVFGRNYWYLFRNGISDTGEPVGIRVLKAYYLTPIRDLEGIVTSYAYLNVIDGGRHQTVYFDIEEVIDFRYVSLSDLYAGGTSWLRACWGKIALSSKWSEYQNWLLDNKAHPSVILQTADDTNPDPKELQRVEKDFVNRLKGSNNGKPITLPPKIKATPFGMTPVDLAPLAIEKELTNRVANAAGIPPDLIGGEATYQNMEQARQHWREQAICPRLLLLEQVINDSLVPLFGDDSIWIEFENPIPEDEAFELQVAASQVQRAMEGRNAGDITKNEHRAFLGLPPLEDGTGDELLKPAPAPSESSEDDEDQDDDDDQENTSSDSSEDPDDDGDSDQKSFDLNAILKINAQVVKGKLPRSVAIVLAAKALDVSEEDARRLIGFAKKTKHKGSQTPSLPAIAIPNGEAIAHVVKAFYGKMKDHFAGQIKSKSLPDRVSTLFQKDAAGDSGLPDEFIPLDAWTDDLDHRLQPLIEMEVKQASDGRVKVLTKIGASPDVFSVVPQKVKQAVQKRSMNLADSTISTTTTQLNDALKALKKQIEEGVLDGDPVAALRDRVQQVFEGLGDDHAELIARTEASAAVHTGQQIAAKASGIVKGFTLLLSDDSCPQCQAVADDTPEIPVDGKFAPDDYDDSPLPVHPFCRCTMTEVLDLDALSASGDDDE